MSEFYELTNDYYLNCTSNCASELAEIRETLIWWGSLQFVISDIIRLYGGCVLLKYVGLLLDSS